MQEKKAKGLVSHSHAQSTWGSMEEKVQVTGLAECCNYFFKKNMQVKKNETKETI